MNKYNIILADCPHEYDNAPPNGSTPYPTMNAEELMSIPVNDIAAKDCVLFYWSTWPKVFEAKSIIESWGFKYSTVGFVWVKTYNNGNIALGPGFYSRSNTEFCLLARRGKIRRLQTATGVSQIIIAPRTKHSTKPPNVHEKIVELFGDLPRIELFARERTPGWDSLGNELDGLDINQSIQLVNICQNIKMNSIHER